MQRAAHVVAEGVLAGVRGGRAVKRAVERVVERRRQGVSREPLNVQGVSREPLNVQRAVECAGRSSRQGASQGVRFGGLVGYDPGWQVEAGRGRRRQTSGGG